MARTRGGPPSSGGTATDRAIDRLVYDLYGLTEGEVAIVEQATARASD